VVHRFDGTGIAAVSAMRWLRSLATLVALAVGVLAWSEDADARLEGGLSLGRGGAGILISPPSAVTAPGVTFAADHATPNGSSSTYPGGSLGGLFNRPGMLGGFAAGFLGAGLLGLLFGHGMYGELGGAASFLGLIFQLALIVMLVRVIWTWWNGAAFGNLSPRQLADAYGRPRNEFLPGADPATDADVEAHKKDNKT
jgi:predicted lipid-binding transport protein (Tim44 family)